MSVNLVKESINQLINDKISKMLYERVANQMCLEPEKITIKEEYKKLNIKNGISKLVILFLTSLSHHPFSPICLPKKKPLTIKKKGTAIKHTP